MSHFCQPAASGNKKDSKYSADPIIYLNCILLDFEQVAEYARYISHLKLQHADDGKEKKMLEMLRKAIDLARSSYSILQQRPPSLSNFVVYMDDVALLRKTHFGLRVFIEVFYLLIIYLFSLSPVFFFFICLPFITNIQALNNI